MTSPISKTYILRTLGCKANVYDTQQIEAELKKRGFRPAAKGELAGLCIINSCTVTDEADRQSRKLAGRLSRENPQATIVVTGCAAEVDPERLSHSSGIHYIIGNRDKPKLVDLILFEMTRSGRDSCSQAARLLGRVEPYSQMASRHPKATATAMDREWPMNSEVFAMGEYSAKTRAFLKIQEGCNSFCTYCIIPYGRGPSRSLASDQVIAQISTLVHEGVREIVLTGTNIGDYEDDLPEKGLAELVERILQETRLERLRVSSLAPTEITAKILEILDGSSGRFCPHFHVSLQSPHAGTLRRMKRRYGPDEIRNVLSRLSSRNGVDGGVFIGMDVITGFPGESESDFEEGLRFLAALPWTRLHVFPYSERAGTPAVRLPGVVPREERARRAKVLNAMSLERMTAWHRAVLESCQASGRPLQGILLESASRKFGTSGESTGGHTLGYTPNYIRVAVSAQRTALRSNQIVSAYPSDLVVDSRAGEVVLLAETVEERY